MKEILRLHVVFISHTESRCPSRDALQLVLKNVAPSIALDGEQYFPPPHLIQIFVARYANLAYDRFERFAGCWRFFVASPFFASVSTVAGISYHLLRSSMTDLMIDVTSVGEASNKTVSTVMGAS